MLIPSTKGNSKTIQIDHLKVVLRCVECRHDNLCSIAYVNYWGFIKLVRRTISVAAPNHNRVPRLGWKTTDFKSSHSVCVYLEKCGAKIETRWNKTTMKCVLKINRLLLRFQSYCVCKSYHQIIKSELKMKSNQTFCLFCFVWWLWLHFSTMIVKMIVKMCFLFQEPEENVNMYYK